MYKYIFKSPIGNIELLSTEKAICKLCITDKKVTLGGAKLSVMQLAEKEISAYLSGKLRNFTVPVCLDNCTVYLKKVLDYLNDMEYGDVHTYSDCAEVINSHPRAVGTGCARNPIPIIIPCHRIVGKNGKMTGFSLGNGVDLKKFLLELERKNLK